MGMIIHRSLVPLNYSRTLRAVRRRETVRRSDDNSRRKMQNVRGDSSAASAVPAIRASRVDLVRVLRAE
jgi:hypothetical protein